MQRLRVSFLPAFFTALAVVFCIALYLRIRSYDREPQPRQQARGSTAAREQSGNAVAGQPAETMTIVEARPTMARSNATAPVETVFNLPPPAAEPSPQTQQPAKPGMPAQEPPKPSLVSRIVQPIVKAISGSKPQPASGQISSSSRPSSSPSHATGEPTSTTRDTDKTSDSVPPQLVSIEFIPQQVRDGEETTLIVQAFDELSGVRSVSGTITAPSGAVQGFACQREGETNRFVARIAVPKDAAEGVWRVNYLSMIDNASNAATFAASQGVLPATATFRVASSRPDAQGPTLLAVWVDKRAIKAGEKNIIHVQTEDDKSGVNLVSGVFQSPSKFARVGFVCRAAAGTTWDCEFNSPVCGDCGDWQLEQIQLQDKANNMTTLRNDNSLIAPVQMDISSDHCDATPPTLQRLMLDRNAVPNNDDTTITVTATMSDDVCGVLNVSGQATGPAASGVPPRLYFSFSAAGDPQTWTGRIVVPRLAAKGPWRITWIQVLDRGHNLKTYSQADAVLAGAAFNVQ